MSNAFKMFCYGQCASNKSHNWGLIGVEKAENKIIEQCPDCKSVLVQKFDKRQNRKIKEAKRKRNPDANYGLKTNPKDYLA